MLPAIQTSINALQGAQDQLTKSADRIANAFTANFSANDSATIAPSSNPNTAAPQVDLETEVANQITAAYDFKANLKVIERINDMSKKLLDIIS